MIPLSVALKRFPFTPRSSIERHLPGVLGALKEAGLGDPEMELMALATIRAETEGVRRKA